MGVEAISTQGEFDAAVTGAPCSMLVVVEFSAGWCDSSQRVATELDSLDGAHVTTSGTKWASALASEGMARTRAGIYKGTVGFFRVDVDEGEELTRDASVHVLPTCARAPQRRRHHHRRHERQSPVARPEYRCACARVTGSSLSSRGTRSSRWPGPTRRYCERRSRSSWVDPSDALSVQALEVPVSCLW
mgnify:CR=1 FL=1